MGPDGLAGPPAGVMGAVVAHGSSARAVPGEGLRLAGQEGEGLAEDFAGAADLSGEEIRRHWHGGVSARERLTP